MNLKLPSRLTYIFCILFLVASCGPKEIKEEAKAENPNIVIIYMDDLGYGDMSAYDAGTLETPNMDKLAEGV